MGARSRWAEAVYKALRVEEKAASELRREKEEAQTMIGIAPWPVGPHHSPVGPPLS